MGFAEENRIGVYFILGYVQQNVITKFYENSKFWTLFAIYRTNNNLSGKPAFVTVFILKMFSVFCHSFKKN